MNTEEKFSLYESLLRKWQGTINLVGPETLNDIRRRHIDDSAQLADFIPAAAKTLFDFGSGAGFPGLVLAMLRPGLDVHLFESDSRKCAFLKTVSRETRTPVTVHNMRIEQAAPDTLPLPDIITARALAPLDMLLDYCRPWILANDALILLFLKGKKSDEEIAAARKENDFILERKGSQIEDHSFVLKLLAIKGK